MKTSLLSLLLLNPMIEKPFIGVVENAHYAESLIENGGYYIEEEKDIQNGDLMAIVNGNLYVVDKK